MWEILVEKEIHKNWLLETAYFSEKCKNRKARPIERSRGNSNCTCVKGGVHPQYNIRVLDPFKPTCPLLLASKRLTECTGETFTRVVLETLQKFELSRSQVLMFVTDDVATMHEVDVLITSPKKVFEISETSSCIPQQVSQYSRTTTDYSYTMSNMTVVKLEFNPNEAAAIKEGQTKFQNISV
ncbi:hypothetical protein NQ318_003370 [Aromia moschata]|uniref:Uncharacterized protein n=1 Tax=Aromia moschata TaxID=1265417 RepID=A0AAV8YAY8_9CUCU|nr:hypothetical protein NQ318_003370 [Aromia moschata]